MVAVEALAAARQPRDVVAAAGAWLGEVLGPHGFRWIPSSRRLQRTVAGLVHQVHLQPSKYNRTGTSVWVGTTLNVRDPALAGWRRAHPDRVMGDGGFVVGHLLGYASGRANGYLYGDADDGDLDLTEPAEREGRLAAFVAMFREGVLPWFTEASTPELVVASRAGDHTNDPVALVEWLASRDRPDLVDAYAQRYLARNVWAEQPYTDGAAAATGGQPNPGRWMVNTATALGWSVAKLTQP
jgi:hypothetical protein